MNAPIDSIDAGKHLPSESVWGSRIDVDAPEPKRRMDMSFVTVKGARCSQR
jgi:hypothetical protein